MALSALALVAGMENIDFANMERPGRSCRSFHQLNKSTDLICPGDSMEI